MNAAQADANTDAKSIDARSRGTEPIRLLAFATPGASGVEETHLRGLLENFHTDIFPFDRRAKVRTFLGLMDAIRRRQHDLIVMEGSGIAGGSAVLLGRLLFGVPYVVSSGDAIGPFAAMRWPLLAPLFSLYERLLCRATSGFIGRSPYLAGRALGFGSPRAMTAAGWASFKYDPCTLARSRARLRAQLGIPANGLVAGIIGARGWTERVGYCYGLELIEALRRCQRPDTYALIVGDGDGRERLARMAGVDLGNKIILTGRVPLDQVPHYLAAMDIASLPQSVDGVGSVRYTTKLSEYLAAGLPVVTGRIPLAYDLDDGWLWRLPGKAPWDDRYIDALAGLINRLDARELSSKRSAALSKMREFDRDRQVARATDFITDLLTDRVAAER